MIRLSAGFLSAHGSVLNQAKLTLIRARQRELTTQGDKATKDYQAAKNAKENHGKRLAAAQNLVEAAFTFDQINPTDEDIDARANCFHQVNALIENLDKDPKRRDHVIDVRNWFDFKAEERFRNPDKAKETYQGAIGKSGGEKSRLASTILATAIAYQYDIEIDRPEGDTFRFVLIDEALSRIGDEFSVYLFEIFSRFHLQLLIIHPRDAKLHITERFVRRYNVALKPERFSSVVNMTVHEFQEYKKRFAAA